MCDNDVNCKVVHCTIFPLYAERNVMKWNANANDWIPKTNEYETVFLNGNKVGKIICT